MTRSEHSTVNRDRGIVRGFLRSGIMLRQVFWLVAALVLLFGEGAAAGRDLILFDQAHGEIFSPLKTSAMDCSEFASLFAKRGLTVKVQTAPLTANALNGTAAFVVSGAFREFSAQEIGILDEYVRNGGNVLVLLHISMPLAPLTERFGLIVSTAIVRERDSGSIIGGNPEDFFLTRFSTDPVFRDVRTVAVFGSWAVLAEGKETRILARTSPQAYADLNGNKKWDTGDTTQSFSILAVAQHGKGRFVVMGDDAALSNQFLHTADNRKLAENLVRWFSGKRKGGGDGKKI